MTASPRSGGPGRSGRSGRETAHPPDPPDPPDPRDPLHLDGLPHDALQRPALAAALRTRLDDLDDVARLRLILLVVNHELRRAPLGLAVEPVPHLPFDGDDDALLHLVADDDAGFFGFLSHIGIPNRVIG